MNNDLLLREYEGDTMTISDHEAIDLKELKADASIKKLVLFHCATKEQTDITDQEDILYHIIPGTYQVHAYYQNGEMENVTKKAECVTYYEAGN